MEIQVISNALQQKPILMMGFFLAVYRPANTWAFFCGVMMSLTKLIRTVANAALDYAEVEIQKKNTKKAVSKIAKKKLTPAKKSGKTNQDK